MNIALVLQHKLLLGFRRLLSGPSGTATYATSWSTGPSLPAQVPYKTIHSNSEALSTSLRTPANSPVARKVMPLRVLREVEKGLPRSCAGRLVISGRMVDVCAELDRLVAREATLH
jgi:hypothetical protein